MQKCPNCEDLKNKITNLQRELHYKNTVLHRKNIELDRLHYVWCSGSCKDGMYRWSDGKVTKEMVEYINNYARRLTARYLNISPQPDESDLRRRVEYLCHVLYDLLLVKDERKIKNIEVQLGIYNNS